MTIASAHDRDPTKGATADLLHRASQARAQGRLELAIDLCLEVLRRKPDEPQACALLGEIALEAGMADRAVLLLARAADQRPFDPALHVNLGAAHQTLRQWDEAEDHYRRALALKPGLVQARSNLGAVLAAKGDVAAAEREYRAAISDAPSFVGAHVNLGNLLRDQGRMTEAIESYRKAVACDPSHAQAHNNLGGTLLLNEMWSEGWAEYEWRWRLGEHAPLRARHTLPLWTGEALAGRRLLVWGEQGLGDVLLLATMLPDLLATGADVVLEVDGRLAPLFARSFPQAAVIPWGASPPPCAFQADIGRLGQFFRSDAAAFAGKKPYLVPDPARVATFKRRYEALGRGPKIGLSWRSQSPVHLRKSLPLDVFAPLFEALPEAVFVSLQYGDTVQERAAFEQRFGVRLFHDDSFDNRDDLDGLAAQIGALDHVVTVSNLNTHFAGAQGVPAHVLVTANALWYWPHGKSTTPWYGSLSLIHVTTEPAPAALNRIAHSIRPSI